MDPIFMVITKNLGIILFTRSATISSTNIPCEFYFQNIVQIHPVLSVTSAVVTGLGKSVFIPIPKKGIAKNV